jgi:hypothetical protein
MALITETRVGRDGCNRLALPQQLSREVELREKSERIGCDTVLSFEASRVAFSAHASFPGCGANQADTCRRSKTSADTCGPCSQETVRLNQSRHRRHVEALTAMPSTLQVCDEPGHVVMPRHEIEIEAENVG